MIEGGSPSPEPPGAIRRLQAAQLRLAAVALVTMMTGTVLDVVRSKQVLIIENAFLRQQRVVLGRQVKRPCLTPKDGWLLVLLASRMYH